MKRIFTAFALLISFSLFAQKNDPEAKALLDKVSAQYKSLKTVQGNYQLVVTTRAGKVAGKKNGKLFVKGTQFKITEPSMEIISDGKKVWKYEADANEVMVSSVETGMNGLTPQKLFTNFYDKDFLYKLNGYVTVNGAKLREVELTPTDKRKNFFKIYLYVDEAKKMIVSSKVLENSGNVYNYNLSNIVTNGALADNLFVFDAKAHPGVDIIYQ